MGDKMNREYFEPGATAFNYNNVTGGADSASGGSGGSGMECLQLRSPPGPFHYLISEQAKSLVALQELQNEVGALLEFRDLVIETFPNLRSKMAPSTPASGTRRDWEPGVRVRRKLAAGTGDTARAKPQPSVQDSGFSTETSCGKDAHSSSASASASATRTRPLEDELWALLDVIQRKGVRLRDEAEQLRGELDDRQPVETVEESFARALSSGTCNECADTSRLRAERDALLVRTAALEASAAATAATSPVAPPPSTPLGRLDSALDTPSRPPRVATPDSKKFAAILLESNPVELQRQLLTSTVQNQVLSERFRRAATQRSLLVERLERARDLNEDLKFRLEEKSIELEGARALVRKLEGSRRSPARDSPERSRDAHSSMRDMEPLHMPDELASHESRLADTPRRRPSRIPLHTGRPASAHSAHSVRSGRSGTSGRSRQSPAPAPPGPLGPLGPPGPLAPLAPPRHKEPKSAVPVRRSPAAPDAKRTEQSERAAAALAAEYVERASRLAPLVPARFPHFPPAYPPAFPPHFPRARPLPRDLLARADSLAQELERSILYENADSVDIKTLRSLSSRDDSLWNGKPQQYFESMNYGERPPSDDDAERDEYDSDSLAP